MPRPRPTRRVKLARTARQRAGMTLLEVVLAVALLAMITAAAMSTVTLIITLSIDDQRRLGAYEVAHKLLLQYLDEKKKMASTSSPIDYAGGRYTYRYRLEETPMEMRTKAREARSSSGEVAADRFKLITIRVYNAVDMGGSMAQGEELAVLSRIMDPIAIMRNPDSIKRALSGEGLNEIITNFSRGSAAPATPAQAVPRPSRGSRSSRTPSSSGGSSR